MIWWEHLWRWNASPASDALPSTINYHSAQTSTLQEICFPHRRAGCGGDAKKIVDHGKALGFQLRSLIDVKCIWEQEMSACL